MAVIKKSKSGKALCFIDDTGVMYTVSVKIVSAVLGDYMKGQFVVLTRMPMLVSEDRFPKSPVFMSSDTQVEGTLSTTNDALSQKQLKKNQENFSKFDTIIL
jgi:hypothetical protein